MRFGIDVINAGHYANPRHAVELAKAAEGSGWESLFIWDHLAFVWGVSSGDPWVILGAVAASTKKIRIGPAVTPVARRRPQVLAQHLVSLDHLSAGRVIFGAGLGGVPGEFAAFGQPFEVGQVASMLDEGLDVIARLWSGEPMTYHGGHYTVENISFQPRPVQQPRIPIWIGGGSRPALRRAARWDGWIEGVHDAEGKLTLTPEQLAVRVDYIRSCRESSESLFDIAVIGNSEPNQASLINEFKQAGATWWLESVHEMRATPVVMLQRVKFGPPKV